MALLLLRGPSPKHTCATTASGQDSSRVAPIAPYPQGPKALTKGGGDENMVEMGDVGRADSGAYYPSLEIPKGEDPDLL